VGWTLVSVGGGAATFVVLGLLVIRDGKEA
jgi:hypothetical protein